MPYVDREGTPEHTTHFKSCGCAEAREAALRAENERLHEQVSSHAGWLWCSSEDLKCAEKRIAELKAALGPFAAGAEHLPPWARDDAFVNIDFPYTSDGDFGERWLIDDRVEVHHFKDAAAALKGDAE